MITKLQHNRFQRETGSIRIMGILLLFGIGLLWAGGQKIYTAVTNRTPTVMGYADYAAKKPSAAWLTLTNCQLDLIHTCFMSYVGDKNTTAQNEYYVPVIDPNSENNKVSMLLKTSDPTLLATLKELGSLKTSEAAKDWVLKNGARIFPRKNITGVVCFGMDLKSGDRDELARTEKNLADDFVILDDQAQPSIAAGASCAVAGLASLCGLVVFIRKK